MSTSLLYHAWDLVGYSYQSSTFKDGAVQFCFSVQDKRLSCPECGSADVIRKGCKTRTFRGCPIGATPVWLSVPIPRVECKACRIVRQIRLGFADPDREHTRQFARYVLCLLRLGTIQRTMGTDLNGAYLVPKTLAEGRLRRLGLGTRPWGRTSISNLGHGDGPWGRTSIRLASAMNC